MRRIPTKRRRGAFDAKKAERPSTNRADCLHIVEPTGESVEQINCGCPGNKMTSVWECDLFGLVAPFAKGDPTGDVRACRKCDRYSGHSTDTLGSNPPMPSGSRSKP